MKDHAPIRVGDELGDRYRILGFLAEGGMGAVYRARDLRLSREVAVKVLPASLESDPDRLRRLEQEARAAGALNHPNILAVYDVGSQDGIPYVVSELLDGTTLREKLAGGALPARKVIDYAVQVAQGLAAAHDKGIVHRDLKPENLFVTREGRVKVLDFGLARRTTPALPEDGETFSKVEGGTPPGTILGTVGYMSPEQVRGKPAQPHSDLFAFGAVVYEMLTGRRAFKGETQADTLTAILTRDPPEITTVEGASSPALERIVRRCLEKDPKARFQSARDLGFALETLFGTTTAPAVPLRRRAQRGWVVPAIAVAALAAGMAAGWHIQADRAGIPAPSFRQITFRRGTVTAARFTPDGQSIVYSAAWDGLPPEVFTARPDTMESRSLGVRGATVLATAAGEMALLVRPTVWGFGTLARTSLAGGAPRDVKDAVWQADWTGDGTRIAAVGWSQGNHHLEFPLGNVIYRSQGLSYPRISPAGDRVAVVSGGSTPRVVVLDSFGNKITESRPFEDVTGLAWSADEREVWISAQEETAGYGLHALQLDGRQRVVTRMAGTITLADVARDGRILMIQSRLRREVVGLARGETAERPLSWMDDSLVLDLSTDGRSFLFRDHGSVYLRDTDGSEPIRLGRGTAAALSPDGRWAAVVVGSAPMRIMLVPTGAGDTKTLPRDGIDTYDAVYWFPDGRRLLIAGLMAGHGVQMFVQDTDRGEPRVLTPEDVYAGNQATHPISPDGHRVLMFEPKVGYTVRATDGGGDSVPLPKGVVTNADVLRWTADGQHLLVLERTVGLPLQVNRLDLDRGIEEPWKELQPADPTGVETIKTVFFTPDGRSYVYSYLRHLSDLYLIEGLR